MGWTSPHPHGTGEIIQTVSDDLSYAFAPKMSVMTAEQAELEQMKRYLENYAPCSVSDAVYFFAIQEQRQKADGAMCLDLIGYADLEGWRCP